MPAEMNPYKEELCPRTSAPVAAPAWPGDSDPNHPLTLCPFSLTILPATITGLWDSTPNTHPFLKLRDLPSSSSPQIPTVTL